MKRKPTGLAVTKSMAVTEDYRCKKCRAKIPHWARSQHITYYHHELLHDFFTPVKNKK